MKVLLDACVWAGAADALREAGHDVVLAADWERDPGDEEVLRRAHTEGRVLVTIDKDFGELAVVRGAAHSGIVRLVGLPARQQGPKCARVLEHYQAELLRGALLTVDRGRVRIRPGGDADADAS